MNDTGMTVILTDGELVDQYRLSRERLDRSVSLLNHALDLHERLWFGLDLDDMRVEVDALKYAVKAHRWWRASQ